ncbi:MAG TPA: 30S ribosomal protein S19e [Candidatus Aenigmarchaeota archaeon]|nr:30S ribosomal protein S19e [Candidatus Aenigmarchaeota archaeon]
MTSAHDVDQQKLVDHMSLQLKDKITMPEWARFVKTGVSRERQPEHQDWYYARSASVLRKIYLDGPVGTERLRTYYGGLHRRGHKPAHFARGGGKIIRTILQQLEGAGYVKKEKKGRSVTPVGQKFVDSCAKNTK